MHRLFSICAAFVLVLLAGCRGAESEKPPIHVNPNMDFQERFDPQEANLFFADKRSMRPPVPGTIPRGFLRDDRAFYEGRDQSGALINEIPIPVTRAVLERGRERYDIYCTPCHGAAGDGQGIVTTGGYGYTPAPSYHTEFMRAQSDGHLYDVITNGIRTMPPYAAQVTVADRWAIVAYIRALQRSQYAPLEDVPASMRSSLAQATPVASADTAAAPSQDTTAADAGAQE